MAWGARLALGRKRHRPAVVPRDAKTAALINARVEFRSLPVLQAIFRKVQRSGSRNKTQSQSLTKSVLNPRSPELWRKKAGESEFWVSAGVLQCRGLRAKARVYWGFFHLAGRQRKFCAGQLAEGVGFEPTIRLPVYTLSRRAPSTTRPPLRSFSRHPSRRILRAGADLIGKAGTPNPTGRGVSRRPVAFCELALSIRGR
jgi:hypothetical protein